MIRPDWLHEVASRCQVFAVKIGTVCSADEAATYETCRSQLPPPVTSLEALALDGLLREKHPPLRFPDNSPGSLSTAVADAKRLIDERFKDVLTYRTIGLEVGRDPEYLERGFRREVGVSLHSYLRHVRLQRGYELITAGQKVESVPSAVGFRSKGGFLKAFQAFYGCTPRAVMPAHRDPSMARWPKTNKQKSR